VRALDREYRLGDDEGLHGGDVIELDGLEIRVVGTPGHSGDSLCFVLPADRAVLTGDTILGRGTTVWRIRTAGSGLPDTLRHLRSLAEKNEIATVLPGHGPVLDDAMSVVDFYLAHRTDRLAQIEAALAAGTRPRRTSCGGSTPTWTRRSASPRSSPYGRSWSTSLAAPVELNRAE